MRKNNHYFATQAQKKEQMEKQAQAKTQGQANQGSPTDKKRLVVKVTGKKAVSKVVEVKSPILSVLEKSKKEDDHFQSALAFANKVSDPKSTAIQTVHVTMQDTLVFNMKKDAEYNSLWTSQQLAQLVAFPRNWKTIGLRDLIKVLAIDLDDFDDDGDNDFDEWDDLSAEERFDLLFETGLQVK